MIELPAGWAHGIEVWHDGDHRRIEISVGVFEATAIHRRLLR
jgi:hypothetical protein